MRYDIWDTDTANLLDSFDDREAAKRALVEMGKKHPEYAEETVLMTIDHQGIATGEVISAADLIKVREAATRAITEHAEALRMLAQDD